jgi:hypothetical protein
MGTKLGRITAMLGAVGGELMGWRELRTPWFFTVGLPDAAVQEARERFRAAIS